MDAVHEPKPIMGNLLREHSFLWYLASDARKLCESYIATGRMDPKAFISICCSFETLEMNDNTLLAMAPREETAGDNYAEVAQFWEAVWLRVQGGEAVDKAFDEEKRADYGLVDETGQRGADGDDESARLTQ